MKTTIFLLLFFVLSVEAETVKIPNDECIQSVHKRTFGGAAYSRYVSNKELLEKAQELASYKEEEVLGILQHKYPDLGLDNAYLSIKSCEVYFKATSQTKIYYFDASDLALAQTKDK